MVMRMATAALLWSIFAAAPARALLAPRRSGSVRRASAASAAETVVDASASIEVRPVEGMGLGVFCTAPICNGTFVCDYAGEVLDSEALLERHPDAEPEYAFRVSDLTYIDAFEGGDHWSARINHNALAPNLDFEVSADPPRVRFTAARPIAVGDELTFDYGPEYWDGRSFAPDASTDARIYAAPVFCDAVDLGVPLSYAAVDDVRRARAPKEEKVAALRRALDYFGVDQAAVPVPPRAAVRRLRRLLRRPPLEPRTVVAADATVRELSRALWSCLAWADEDNDDAWDDASPPPA